MSRPARLLLLVLALFCAVPTTAVAQDDFDATVRRSAHGIPHITGSSFGDVAYGYGYAFAQDNICVIADQYVTVSGERSKFFGPDATWEFRGNGSKNRNLESDFFFKRIIAQRTIERLMERPVPDGPRPEVREGVRGYVAGYNRYLRETGVANLPDPACRGKDWVRPITEMDVYRRFYQLALLASGAVAINGIGGAQPPPPGDVGGGARTGDREAAERLAEVLPPLDIGSNAYGIGREQTDNGKGMLLGNPHFPWDGSERFYQSHLTIPGKVDVQGGSLFGVPIVLIGNTRGLAWSHTVSTAFRFTPFELTLVPGSPTTYLVDGRPKEMTRTELTVETPDGPVTRTLYDTEYGPMFTEILGQPLFPWGQGKAFAMGDANAANFRYLNHFFETNMAQSVREYDAILRRNQGIPWVNSIAADAGGEAYYADISVVPHVTDEQAGRCNTTLGTATFRALRLPVLDGSRSTCNWGRDPSAIQPGTFGPEESLPSMFRADYTMNANDSYWLGNLRQRLEGFARIIGDERTARSLRTRIGLLMVDGERFTQQKLMDTVFNNRQYAGELWRDEAVAMCEQTPGAERACPVLAAWNVRDDLDSRGALLFRRFAQRLLGGGPTSPGAPFDTPFDPEDPANTPRGLRTEDPRVRQALLDAIRELDGLQIPLDAPLGDVQAEVRGDERLPIHGGPGTAGVFNALNVRTADLQEKTGYETVPHGSSYVQVVQFVDGACPVEPRTILTYSQSTNPRSPFFSDQTRLYGRKQWVDVPFCEDEVARATESTVRLRGTNEASGGPPAVACRQPASLRRALVRGGRRGRVAWRGRGRVGVDVFRVSSPREVIGNRRVARWRAARGSRRLPRRARPGLYVVRFRARDAQRRIAVRRSGGRWRVQKRFDRRSACGPLRRFKLERPVFGGRDNRALGIAFRLAERADVVLQVRRGSRVVRTVRSTGRAAGRTHRLRLASERLRRGRYRFVLTVRAPTGTIRSVLGARRL